MAFEMAGEVCLVIETDTNGYVTRWLSFEETLSGGVDASPQQVGMRRDPERSRETPP